MYVKEAVKAMQQRPGNKGHAVNSKYSMCLGNLYATSERFDGKLGVSETVSGMCLSMRCQKLVALALYCR